MKTAKSTVPAHRPLQAGAVDLFAPVEHAPPAAPAAEVRLVLFDEYLVDPEIQSRAAIDPATVQRYEAVYREKGAYGMPALVLYEDAEAGKRWLVKGFHRDLGGRGAGLSGLPCEVKPGTRRQAILDATGDNEEHGLPRSDLDRAFAVLKYFRDPEWRDWAYREIARRARVAPTFVSNIHKILPLLAAGKNDGEVLDEVPSASPGLVANVRQLGGATVHHGQVPAAWLADVGQPRPRMVERAGKQVLMDTTNIGRRQKEAAAQRRAFVFGPECEELVDEAQVDEASDDGLRNRLRDLAAGSGLASTSRRRAEPPKEHEARQRTTAASNRCAWWEGKGEAWARRQQKRGGVPKDDNALRRLLAAHQQEVLHAAQWGAEATGGQPDKARALALHHMAAGARREARRGARRGR